MGSTGIITAILLAGALLQFCTLPVLAERRSAVEVVDIDRPLVFTMDYDRGERMQLSADIEVSGPPISIFLIKGRESYREWERSEDVDIDDIKTGNASMGMNATFQVVINFSVMNVTEFHREIDIGDKDVYYLVIALHRYAGMPAKEALLMTTIVDYEVAWDFQDKDVPLWLLPVALLFFIAGTVMVVYYSWRTAVQSKVPDRDGPERRGPVPKARSMSGEGPRRMQPRR